MNGHVFMLAIFVSQNEDLEEKDEVFLSSDNIVCILRPICDINCGATSS